MKLLLRHRIYTCIYCVKIFSRWNIPKTRSEAEKSVKISVKGPFKQHYLPSRLVSRFGLAVRLASERTSV